ncbi:MAG: hypothetical protein QXR30_02955 [Candidatus Woesearchaeota archaeon]
MDSYEYNLLKRERNLVDLFEKNSHFLFYENLRKNFSYADADKLYAIILTKISSLDYSLLLELKAGIEDKINDYYNNRQIYSSKIFDELEERLIKEAKPFLDKIRNEYNLFYNIVLSNLNHLKDHEAFAEALINMTLAEIITLDLTYKEISSMEMNYAYLKYDEIKNKILKNKEKRIYIQPEFDAILNASLSISDKDFMRYLPSFFDHYKSVFGFVLNKNSFENLKNSIQDYKNSMDKICFDFLEEISKKNIYFLPTTFELRYKMLVPKMEIYVNESYYKKLMVQLDVSYFSIEYQNYILEKFQKIKSFNLEILEDNKRNASSLFQNLETLIKDPLKSESIFLEPVLKIIQDAMLNNSNYSNIFFKELKNQYLKIAFYGNLIESLDLIQDYFNYSNKLEKFNDFLNYLDNKCNLR